MKIKITYFDDEINDAINASRFLSKVFIMKQKSNRKENINHIFLETALPHKDNRKAEKT